VFLLGVIPTVEPQHDRNIADISGYRVSTEEEAGDEAGPTI
jgi:hypothetical protein